MIILIGLAVCYGLYLVFPFLGFTSFRDYDILLDTVHGYKAVGRLPFNPIKYKLHDDYFDNIDDAYEFINSL
jgi:ABC-type transporter lipoprotein component MlaA